MLTITDHALRYAALGWLVVPVCGKVPIGTDWQNKATNQPGAVAKIFAQTKPDGVGVLLGYKSGLIDFDCDSEESEATIQAIFGGTIPETPVFKSGRGLHRLFKYTDKLPRPDLIKIVIDGLEIRTGAGEKGAQTVFPPSGPREWIKWPDDCELAEIPESVITEIHRRYSAANKPKELKPQNGFSHDPATGFDNESLNVPRWLAKHGRQIIGRTEGSDGVTRWHIECPGIERHTTKNSFRDCCVTQDAAGRLGGSCFHASCGMSDWQTLKATIGELEWSDFHEEEQQANADLSAILIEAIPQTKKQDEPKSPDALNDRFYEVAGVIGEMVKHHRRHAPRPRPELSLAASIAMVGAISGRKIKTSTGLRTNVYLVGLAPSGSGKEGPRNDNVKAFNQSQIPQYLGSEDPASDSALVRELHDRPSLLMQIDEMSMFFGNIKMAGGGQSHLKNIKKRLLELVGAAANPAWTPKGFADKKNVHAINHPHLCIYGTSTGEGFWNSVTTNDATDGLLARLLVIESSEEYPRLRHVDEDAIPQGVIEILQDWHRFSPGGGNLSDQHPQAVTVHFDSAALERIQTHSDGIEDRLPGEPDYMKAIWSRASASAKKLSLIFAASRGPHGIVVKLEDAEAAVRLVNWCTRLMVRRVFTSVSANEEDSQKKKVLNLIRKAGELSSSQLTRQTQWIRGSRERNSILNELLDGQFITFDTKQTAPSGPATRVYRCV